MRASSRSTRRWDAEDDADHDHDDAFLSTTDLNATHPPVARRSLQSRRFMARESPQPAPRRWPPSMETQTSLGFSDWPFDGSSDARTSSSLYRTAKGTAAHGSRALSAASGGFDGEQLGVDCPDGLHGLDDYKTARVFRTDYEMEPRHRETQLQGYHQQRQYQRTMQQELIGDMPSSQLHRKPPNHPADHGCYAREMRAREPLDDMPFEPPRRISRSTLDPGSSTFESRPSGLARDVRVRDMQNRRYNALSPSSTRRLEFGPRIDEMPLESATLDMYPDDDEPSTTSASMSRPREYIQAPISSRQRVRHQMPRRPQYGERLNDDEMMIAGRQSFQDPDLSRDRRGTAGRALYEDLVPTSMSADFSRKNSFGNVSPSGAEAGVIDQLSSRERTSHLIMRLQKTKRPRPHNLPIRSPTKEPAQQALKAKKGIANTPAASTASPLTEKEGEGQSKRRCGRKSMNYSSEQKRERNRAAVKKCRQRQALKMEYLQHKAESLAAENQALSEMLVNNTKLAEEQRISLKRGIQMDILLKIKEIFTQSLPKDFVLDADSIWDLNSVLAVSMPSRCYYGIESIKDFWRTSLRMRNKGKIRSFWAWLFRLPPGDRFAEFEIHSLSPTSNLYFISWTTKSTPPLAGTMAIMFGNGHRVTLYVECFGWLIWRYLLTNEPFPEPAME